MGTFLDKAHEPRRSGRAAGYEKDFDRVEEVRGILSQVNAKTVLDVYNLETVFSALEMAKTLKAFPGRDVAYIDESVVSFRRVIRRTLDLSIDRMMISPQETINTTRAYAEFAQLLMQLVDGKPFARSVALLTFNYDLCLDFALRNKGMVPLYCVNGPQPPPKGAAARYIVPLLKLHGSLNFAVAAEKPNCPELKRGGRVWEVDDIVRQYSAHPAGERRFPSLRFADWPQTDGRQLEEEPEIVPPTWNKAEGHRSLSYVWSAAAKELSEAEEICIIGYSLPESDSFFRFLFGLGAGAAKTIRRLTVVDPEANGAVGQRFASLLGPVLKGRYHPIQEKFEKSVGAIASALHG